MIAKDLKTLDTVEGQGFRELMELACPEYQVPSRRTITRVVSEMAVEKRAKICTELQTVEHVCLTVDFWTSIAMDTYVVVVCHFLDADWNMKTWVLESREVAGSHTSENIVDLLSLIENEWELKGKVVCYVTDNAANIVKAVKEMGVGHVRSAAHTLELTGKARRIVGHFKHSSVALADLHKAQEKYGLSTTALIQDVCTRWNSTHDMLQTLLKNRQAVNSVIMDNAKTEGFYISNEDATVMKAVADVLEPCAESTTLLGGERYTTASVALQVFHNLQKTMALKPGERGNIATLKSTLAKHLQDRWTMLECLLTTAAALDPRFKALRFLDEEERQEIWTTVLAEIKTADTDEPRQIRIERESPPPEKRQCSLLDDTSDEDDVQGDTLPAETELALYQNEVKPKFAPDPNNW
ncbi:hypothetical protein SKAU_G00234510 [Synaphobranchus kaupii]|uniref:Transposase n=1 Tax=Synaphobranchus kaupii TaxID=118154 RepID=A0A9Q1F6I1_SYNKA|nr:hypothetical protein SKAU_G00234510 [Synaphobranchus kaupii]